MAATATSLATSILNRLQEADEDIGQFIKVSGWVACGHETFTDWWTAEAMPVLAELNYLNVSLKQEVRDVVLKQVREENATKPKAQRLRQREMAKLVGANQATVSRSTTDACASTDDLEDRPDWVPKAVELAKEGMSFRQIATEVGRHHGVVSTRPEVREARHEANNYAVGSVAHPERSIACSVEPASDLISSIELDLRRLVSRVYTLSPKDRQRTKKILEKYIEQLEGYKPHVS